MSSKGSVTKFGYLDTCLTAAKQRVVIHYAETSPTASSKPIKGPPVFRNPSRPIALLVADGILLQPGAISIVSLDREGNVDIVIDNA